MVMATRVLSAAGLAMAIMANAWSPQSGGVDASALAAFVDSLMASEMARDRIPGAAFVFVQNGQVLLSRGYGLADVARQRRVVPDSTIWRIGSISKAFTATAVMQLVDRGLVELDAPVERYVHRVAIPHAYPEPITVRQLLDHTAGLDEIRPGTQAPTRELVLPLAEFLEHRLVQVRPPGRTIAYSTYGMTLAGELVEEVSGVDFETFLRRNIWDPLGMARSSIDVPATLSGDVAMGYELQGDSLAPQPWEWYHTTPASSVNTTASAMARFLLAHLQESAGSTPILSPRTMEEMHRHQVTMHPSIPGYALGFNEDFIGDLRVLEHGGNVAGFSALMVLVPSERAGFFVVNHVEGSTLRNNLKWLLLERFFPAARRRHPVPATLPPSEQFRPERFAGQYIPLTSCFSCQPVRAGSVLRVTANPDGTLGFVGARWIWVDSLRFVQEKGTGYIVFREDSAGAIKQVFAGAYWGWQKLP
jgi:CubicO group peptidase (beta-lactamase class C family)